MTRASAMLVMARSATTAGVLSWVLAAGTATAQASGDAAAGEAHFARQCVSCHVVTDPSGVTLAGRTARTGPNLHGVVGRMAGSAPGFVYGSSITAYGLAGGAWTEEAFSAYVRDPTGFLRAALSDRGARGRMAYQVRDAQEARDLYAYLALLAR